MRHKNVLFSRQLFPVQVSYKVVSYPKKSANPPPKGFKLFHRIISRDTNRKCPGKCHPILLTNVTLRCEKDDLHVMSAEICEEKKLPLTSCLVNAFKPFSKGKAWSVNNAVR